MSNIKENLLLVEVTEVTGEKITLSFLDESEGYLYEVHWNLRKYNPDAKGTNKWEPSEEQEAQVEEWAQEYFGVPTGELKNLGDQGIRKDVYHYDTFNSLWEVSRIEKFDKSREGEILTVEVTGVDEDAKGLRVLFQEDGKTYSVNFSTSKFVESFKKYIKDPVQYNKALKKFEDTFGITWDNREKLIGETIMVEIKLAFGTHSYAQAKKLTDANKKRLAGK